MSLATMVNMLLIMSVMMNIRLLRVLSYEIDRQSYNQRFLVHENNNQQAMKNNSNDHRSSNKIYFESDFNSPIAFNNMEKGTFYNTPMRSQFYPNWWDFNLKKFGSSNQFTQQDDFSITTEHSTIENPPKTPFTFNERNPVEEQNSNYNSVAGEHLQESKIPVAQETKRDQKPPLILITFQKTERLNETANESPITYKQSQLNDWLISLLKPKIEKKEPFEQNNLNSANLANFNQKASLYSGNDKELFRSSNWVPTSRGGIPIFETRSNAKFSEDASKHVKEYDLSTSSLNLNKSMSLMKEISPNKHNGRIISTLVRSKVSFPITVQAKSIANANFKMNSSELLKASQVQNNSNNGYNQNLQSLTTNQYGYKEIDAPNNYGWQSTIQQLDDSRINLLNSDDLKHSDQNYSLYSENSKYNWPPVNPSILNQNYFQPKMIKTPMKVENLIYTLSKMNSSQTTSLDFENLDKEVSKKIDITIPFNSNFDLNKTNINYFLRKPIMSQILPEKSIIQEQHRLQNQPFYLKQNENSVGFISRDSKSSSFRNPGYVLFPDELGQIRSQFSDYTPLNKFKILPTSYQNIGHNQHLSLSSGSSDIQENKNITSPSRVFLYNHNPFFELQTNLTHESVIENSKQIKSDEIYPYSIGNYDNSHTEPKSNSDLQQFNAYKWSTNTGYNNFTQDEHQPPIDEAIRNPPTSYFHLSKGENGNKPFSRYISSYGTSSKILHPHYSSDMAEKELPQRPLRLFDQYLVNSKHIKENTSESYLGLISNNNYNSQSNNVNKPHEINYPNQIGYASNSDVSEKVQAPKYSLPSEAMLLVLVARKGTYPKEKEIASADESNSFHIIDILSQNENVKLIFDSLKKNHDSVSDRRE